MEKGEPEKREEKLRVNARRWCVRESETRRVGGRRDIEKDGCLERDCRRISIQTEKDGETGNG